MFRDIAALVSLVRHRGDDYDAVCTPNVVVVAYQLINIVMLQLFKMTIIILVAFGLVAEVSQLDSSINTICIFAT